MIYSACILNSNTRVVINRVSIDTDKPHEINLPEGTELAPRHDGNIGWTLLENGEWYDPAPQERITKAQGIRNRRDYKLKSSDKYVIPDFPISSEKKAQWLQYRQDLRNITLQPGFPDNVVWPVKPD